MQLSNLAYSGVKDSATSLAFDRPSQRVEIVKREHEHVCLFRKRFQTTRNISTPNDGIDIEAV